MKSLKLITLFAAFLFIFTSCEEDPIGGGGGVFTNGPSVFLSTSGEVSGDVELPVNSTFSVILDATKGDLDIQALTVLEDGVAIDNARFSINGDAAAANPVLVFAPDTEGFLWTITVDAQNETGESKTFTFRVQDTDGNNDSVSVTVSTAGATVPPTLTIEGSGDFMGQPLVAATINISGTPGDSPLNSITVLESLDNMTFSEVSQIDILFFDNLSTSISSNPFFLEGEDKNGFAKPFYIKADYAGTVYYQLVLTDEAGNSDTQTFRFTSGTAFTTELNGVLFNAGGPTGTGGLDLDNGEGTGSSDAEAEIRDAGIDTDQPADQNWLQRIAAVNGGSMREITDALQVEGIGFADINFQEFLPSFYEDAADFTFSGPGGLMYSDVVSVGDVFVVRGANRDYIIQIAEVNVRTMNNEDNYLVNIKY